MASLVNQRSVDEIVRSELGFSRGFPVDLTKLCSHMWKAIGLGWGGGGVEKLEENSGSGIGETSQCYCVSLSE